MAVVVALGAGCTSSHRYSDRSSDYPYEDPRLVSTTAYFYEELEPYGEWFQLAPYGRVWSPHYSTGWRPYTVGRWAYTDDGWMWLSQDPWGGAPYHYGRWAHTARHGWVWVPGEVWAPSWVAWRHGNGWVGWAPLPPEATWRWDRGLDYAGYDLNRSGRAHVWTFVPERDFVSSNIRTRVVSTSRNPSLLSSTRNVTKYTVDNSRPVERGFRRSMIQNRIGVQIPKYRIVEQDRYASSRRGAMIRGRTIEVYRPPLSVRSERVARTHTPIRTSMMRERAARQEAERIELEARLRRDRMRLAREHESEIQNPPRGAALSVLRRRHREELRAQAEVERREREVFRTRQRQLRESLRETERAEREQARIEAGN